ncbi:4-oxalocrotonate tautomerase family protein [Sinorhizobium sp. BG8]|uniref:tautomerase family protein n=1 Tax=Sinorhizobium sp. BG8 TaxID=2613773 RepID=UPI00193CF51D|nr:4-oxalocrotonate tautomerase family protein [Sinorhizobium sp. BG8]QRM55295.1 4-oxalocrotonate tautomerase family protein [Sinorhizobium sp. BG8]
MPIIRVELFPGRTEEVKARLAHELTASLERVAGVPPEATTVLITEVPPHQWFVAGKAYGSPPAEAP